MKKRRYFKLPEVQKSQNRKKCGNGVCNVHGSMLLPRPDLHRAGAPGSLEISQHLPAKYR